MAEKRLISIPSRLFPAHPQPLPPGPLRVTEHPESPQGHLVPAWKSLSRQGTALSSDPTVIPFFFFFFERGN